MLRSALVVVIRRFAAPVLLLVLSVSGIPAAETADAPAAALDGQRDAFGFDMIRAASVAADGAGGGKRLEGGVMLVRKAGTESLIVAGEAARLEPTTSGCRIVIVRTNPAAFKARLKALADAGRFAGKEKSAYFSADRIIFDRARNELAFTGTINIVARYDHSPTGTYTLELPDADRAWLWTQTCGPLRLTLSTEPGRDYQPSTPVSVAARLPGQATRVTTFSLLAARPASAVTAVDRRAAEILAEQAWRFWGDRKYAEVEADFLKMAELDSNNPATWNGLGWACYHQGKMDQARAAFERGLALEPKNAAALNGLGWVARGLGQTADAMTCWKQALDVAPNAVGALAGLAGAYHELHKDDIAEEYYDRWLRIEPGNQTALKRKKLLLAFHISPLSDRDELSRHGARRK